MEYCNVCEMDVEPVIEKSSLMKQLFDVNYDEPICPHCQISLELSKCDTDLSEEEHKLLIKGLKMHKKEGSL